MKELIGASTELITLGVIAREPDYGYRILRRVNEAAAGVFTWAEGTLYPVLHKLEKRGLVKATWKEGESGRRRRYYAITAAGRVAMKEQATQWTSMSDIVRAVIMPALGGAS